MLRRRATDVVTISEHLSYYLATRRGNRTLRRAHRCANKHRADTPTPAPALPDVHADAGRHHRHG